MPEVAKPTAPATGEDAAAPALQRVEERRGGAGGKNSGGRRREFFGLARGRRADVKGLAHALACDDGTAAALLRTYGGSQIRTAGDLKVGLWAPWRRPLDLDDGGASSASPMTAAPGAAAT